MAARKKILTESNPIPPLSSVSTPALEMSVSAPVDVSQELQNFPVTQAQEHTRGKIALYFTYVYLFLVGISMLGPMLANLIQPHLFADPVESGKNLITTLSSVLAAPFGFIVGFYFKQQEVTQT